MEIKLIFAILSSLITFVGYSTYVIDIFKKKTEPHLYSWLIWTILPVIGVLSQFKDGSGYGSWGLIVGCFFCAIIVLSSFKYGTKNITNFDIFCLITSLFAIFIYLNIQNPIWSIITVSIIDVIGFLPTFRKAYVEPLSETPIAFGAMGISHLLSLLALQNYTFTTIFYLAVLFFANSTLSAMIFYRKIITKSGKKV